MLPPVLEKPTHHQEIQPNILIYSSLRTFGLSRTFKPGELEMQGRWTDQHFEEVAQDLLNDLFAQEVSLQDAIEGGLVPCVEACSIEHFDLESHFDHAVCRLKLRNVGPSRFFCQTSFYLGQKLITRTLQEGVLGFPELA